MTDRFLVLVRIVAARASVALAAFGLTLAAMVTLGGPADATTSTISGTHGAGPVNFATVRHHSTGPLSFKLTETFAYCPDTWGISLVNSVNTSSRFAGWKNWSIPIGLKDTYSTTQSWGSDVSAINFRVSARGHNPTSSVVCMGGVSVQEIDFTGRLTY